MKSSKKYLPLFSYLIILGVGLILFFINKNSSLFSSEKFLSISLIIVGGVGFLATFFIVKFSKPIQDFTKNTEDDFTDVSKKISEQIKEFTENNSETSKNNQINAEEQKHKKIKCSYCKCKFDSSLNRCPNCGAPPDFEN